jgi:predicted MFS family arabinose efflux permease
MSRALALVFVSTCGAMSGFYLLLSVLPLYATSIGADKIGAGSVTAALMFSTVAAELATPRLVGRFGRRRVLVTGMALLGAPLLALPGTRSLALILTVCVVRGLGFAITVVVTGAMVAAMVPDERRGEGLGLYGVVVGVPSVIALPLGVWLTGQVGYTPVFVAGALLTLGGSAAALGVGTREPQRPRAGALGLPGEPFGVLAALRTASLVRPAVVFSVTAMAAGAIVTFLPVAMAHASGTLAAAALLAMSISATISRWWAGRHGDRHGSAGLLVPAVVVAAAGVLGLVLIASPVAVMAGALVFGTGYGAAQNISLASMLEKVSASGYGTVSAVWNLSFDAGLGVGAAGFGVLAAQTGYSVAFALTGVLMFGALTVARREKRIASAGQE